MHSNSKYYSAKCPPRLQNRVLPHVTIQCPVYKEGLASVIAPTVKSIKQAISTYELQGGSANMFVNDDGLQIIDEEERRARIEFYADHSIGWTARPKHGANGFVRKGKFKKVRRHFVFSSFVAPLHWEYSYLHARVCFILCGLIGELLCEPREPAYGRSRPYCIVAPNDDKLPLIYVYNRSLNTFAIISGC